MRDLWYIEGVTKVSVEEYYRREFCFFLFTARAQKQDKVGNTIFKKHTKGKLASCLKKFVAPVGEALVTVTGLLRICTGRVFEPINKQVLVFLQDKKLAKNNIGLENMEK